MADYSVNTQAPAYNTRRQQFSDIMNYYGPQIAIYLNSDEDRMKQIRQSDIFLRELLEFVRKVNEEDKTGLGV